MALTMSESELKVTLNGGDGGEVALESMVVFGGGGRVVEREAGARRGLEVAFTGVVTGSIVVDVVVISVVKTSSSSTSRRGPNVVDASSVKLSRRRIQSSTTRE